MNVVLIGVSDRTLLQRDGKIKEDEYEKFVNNYAEFLSKKFNNVIVTPDDGVYTDIAKAFGKIKGKKPIAYYPDKDEYYGYKHLEKNFQDYEIKPIEGDWYKLNADLTKQAQVIICLGFSPGSLIELAFIKYHQKYGKYKNPNLENISLLIDERCISSRLPLAFEEQIKNIHYFSSLKSLNNLLKEITKNVNV